MTDSDDRIRDLAESVRLLAEAQQGARRRGWLMLGAGLTFGFLMGAGMGAPATAEGFLQRAEQTIQQDEQKLRALEEATKKDLEVKMQGLRKELSDDIPDVNSEEKMIAVLMNEIMKALQAVPTMAREMTEMNASIREMNAKMTAMPIMAGEMQAMNVKMGIMSYGVDSTMGRMGRAMPWAPW